MIDRATLDRLPRLHALRVHAMTMQEAFESMHRNEPGSIATFIAAWNRARKTWQNYSGETLP